MTATTVSQFAVELKMPEAALLEQLGKAGVGKQAGADVLTDQDKSRLLEYLRRDVANLALGNKDNHARNTAIQRDFNGAIQLTPVFDFAPMYLHPDGIARHIRWQGKERETPDWNAILGEVCEACDLPREPLVAGLLAMVQPLLDVAREADAFGLEPEVRQYLLPGIHAQARALELLH